MSHINAVNARHMIGSKMWNYYNCDDLVKDAINNNRTEFMIEIDDASHREPLQNYACAELGYACNGRAGSTKLHVRFWPLK